MNKRLPEQFLLDLGVHDLPGGGVGIPYWSEDGGTKLYTKERDNPRRCDGDGARLRFWVPGGTEQVPYGRWRLGDRGTIETILYLTEGESDTWTAWYQGLPALGLPGATMFTKLQPADLAGVKDLCILPHSDKSGREMIEGIRNHLPRLGYHGTLHVAGLPAPDLSDLYTADPAGFPARWREVLAGAKALFLDRDPPSRNGGAPAPAPVPAPARWPETIPSSQLRVLDPARLWLWKGFLARGEITLFCALWKAGKTTLLAHLLRAFEAGGDFLGHLVTPARVLYVTEECESRWAERRDALGLRDHLEFLIRPFTVKPDFAGWTAFLRHLLGLQQERRYDAVVIDPLTDLWPVKDENDAAHVQECLMPLRGLLADAAVNLVHHVRKSDGDEATASRGSGALTSFVDTIVEFRRLTPGDQEDRRRVLRGYGRREETPHELVIELSEEGYRTCGARAEVRRLELMAEIAGLLPHEPPGWTTVQILEAWPEPTRPKNERFHAALSKGVEEGRWSRQGEGRRGNPYTYWGAHDAPDPWT